MLLNARRRKLFAWRRLFARRCYGGHGRTGTVIVNLLQTMGAAASPAEAMALLRARHASRGCHSCALLDGELEAPEQEAQAAALASQHKRGRMLQ